MQTHESSSIQSRHYMSPSLAIAGRQAANAAVLIENSTNPDRNAAILKHRAWVISAVVSAAAFMEAAINEFLSDGTEGFPPYGQVLTPEMAELLRFLWLRERGGIDRMTPLEKFDAALKFAGREPQDRGMAPRQHSEMVINLRNLLMHYKPEWVDHQEEHWLERRLHALKIPENPLLPEPNPYWPDRLLSGGLATWAIDSSVAVADDLFQRLGVVSVYETNRVLFAS